LGVGKRVLKLRLQAGMTQKELARAARIAVAYLCRLEHERIIPSVRTLTKIAAALKVEMGKFFGNRMGLEPADRCPVSLTGRCILDESFVGSARRSVRNKAGYTHEQLMALRICNGLLHTSNVRLEPRLVETLKALLALDEARRLNAARLAAKKRKTKSKPR
jgi:transcriptional regulator with XRE-family HTH domain